MKTISLPSRPAKSFGEVVTLPALAELYESMPKVKADEVFQGLKGKADKGENFTRFAFLAWKGSINADQVKAAFAGALRVAMLAAFHAAIQGRDQNAALPGEVVGRAWGAASVAWGECPERAANDSKAKAPANKGEGEGQAAASTGNEATASNEAPISNVPSPKEASLAAELAEARALLDAIAMANSIKAVRALLQQSGYIEAKAA